MSVEEGWGWGRAEEMRAVQFVCCAGGGVKWEQCHLERVTLLLMAAAQSQNMSGDASRSGTVGL